MAVKKKFFQYKGIKHRYNTKAEFNALCKKLNITPTKARKLDKESGDRTMVDGDGKTLKYNLKTDKFSGLLKEYYGIGRVNNDKIIDEVADFPKKNATSANKLGPDEDVKLTIRITLYLNFGSPVIVTNDDIKTNGEIDQTKINEYVESGGLVIRFHDYAYDGTVENMDEEIDKEAKHYADNHFQMAELIYYTYDRLSYYLKRKFEYEDGFLKDFGDQYELTEWANLEEKDNYDGEDTCVPRLISKRFNSDLYWKIKKLETEKGVMLKDFMNFCKTYLIEYFLYDEHGKETHTFENKNKIGSIHAIIYNNHIYPTKGGKPKRVSYKKYNIVYTDNIKQLLKEMLEEKKKLPFNIKFESMHLLLNSVNFSHDNGLLKGFQVSSFIDKDTKYVGNPDYKTCLKILTKMGFEEYITNNIRVTDIPRLLEKIFKPTGDLSSFIPEKDLFKTPPLLWKTNKKIDWSKVSTIDKNKCYAYALYMLDYLIKFDYRKHRVTENPTRIIPSYLYVAEPINIKKNYWHILMPGRKIYPGYHLNKCSECGIKFTLLEELETDRVPNFYREIIALMYKHMSMDVFKKVMVILIGSFERSYGVENVFKYNGTYTNQAAEAQEGYYSKLGKYFVMFDNTQQHLHVRDRLPINNQIKDQVRLIIYNKIIELGITDEQLVQINTDSISYYGELPKKLDPNDFRGWKESESSENKEIGAPENKYRADLSVINILNKNENPRILFMKYAGAGKTTQIKDDIIPLLEKTKKSYIVCTPTHATLCECIKAGIKNCRVIQDFVLPNTDVANTVPDVDVVIIDEIGFIGSECHDFLYKLSKAGKIILCYGDFYQLPPVGEDRRLNQPHYLKYMFNKIDENYVNYRNNFTTKYYDSLIHSNNKKYLAEQVKKYSTKNPSKADYVLCFRHPTRQAYNKIILEQKGFKHWLDVGVELVCITNKLRGVLQNKGGGMFNHRHVTIIESENTAPVLNRSGFIPVGEEMKDNKYSIKVKDSDGKEYSYTNCKESWFEKRFQPAYAINIHQAQGMTLNSYYWADEDDFFLKGSVAYTIISRIWREKKTFILERELSKFIEWEKKRKNDLFTITKFTCPKVNCENIARVLNRSGFTPAGEEQIDDEEEQLSKEQLREIKRKVKNETEKWEKENEIFY